MNGNEEKKNTIMKDMLKKKKETIQRILHVRFVIPALMKTQPQDLKPFGNGLKILNSIM